MTSYTWQQQAEWLFLHRPEMRFARGATVSSICTAWIDDDPEAEKVDRLLDILTTFFGAYQCGPYSNWEKAPPHGSFGFWNEELLANARRVFTLPDNLETGPIVYLTPIPAEYWQRLVEIYDKRVEDLPRR